MTYRVPTALGWMQTTAWSINYALDAFYAVAAHGSIAPLDAVQVLVGRRWRPKCDFPWRLIVKTGRIDGRIFAVQPVRGWSYDRTAAIPMKRGYLQ
jgi:hypothetical protein